MTSSISHSGKKKKICSAEKSRVSKRSPVAADRGTEESQEQIVGQSARSKHGSQDVVDKESE